MTITKAWLEEQINNEVDAAAKTAYQRCYAKLTEAPNKTTPTQKIMDHDKVYADIVKYYIEKKGYTPEQANQVALKVVEEQQQKRMNEFGGPKDG